MTNFGPSPPTNTQPIIIPAQAHPIPGDNKFLDACSKVRSKSIGLSRFFFLKKLRKSKATIPNIQARVGLNP